MQLKERFLAAVLSGELGARDDHGILVELKEFKKYFSDVPRNYVGSFLPAATIEPGQYSMTSTKYVFRIKQGIYRIHPELTDTVNQTAINASIGTLHSLRMTASSRIQVHTR